MLRIAAGVVALALFTAAGVLGYIAAIAVRRSEGVFMPAGFTALACLALGAVLLRIALRG